MFVFKFDLEMWQNKSENIKLMFFNLTFMWAGVDVYHFH